MAGSYFKKTLTGLIKFCLKNHEFKIVVIKPNLIQVQMKF